MVLSRLRFGVTGLLALVFHVLVGRLTNNWPRLGLLLTGKSHVKKSLASYSRIDDLLIMTAFEKQEELTFIHSFSFILSLI